MLFVTGEAGRKRENEIFGKLRTWKEEVKSI